MTRLLALIAGAGALALAAALAGFDVLGELAQLVVDEGAAGVALAGAALLAFSALWLGLARWTFELLDRARRQLELEAARDEQARDRRWHEPPAPSADFDEKMLALARRIAAEDARREALGEVIDLRTRHGRPLADVVDLHAYSRSVAARDISESVGIDVTRPS